MNGYNDLFLYLLTELIAASNTFGVIRKYLSLSFMDR